SVLDMGCGIGLTDSYLVEHFGQVHGVDLSESLIKKAHETNPGAFYKAYDGRKLPFSDGSFDLVFAMVVFHHVEPAEWDRLASEMTRVARPGGIVVIFEHNPYNFLTRIAVDRCEFDEGTVLLSKKKVKGILLDQDLSIIDQKYILFFPWHNSFFF